MKVSYHPRGHVKHFSLTIIFLWTVQAGVGFGVNLMLHNGFMTIAYGVGVLLFIVGYFLALFSLEYEYEIGDKS